MDVKKVLVIGSGGLSIGQAGEFDYSGKLQTDTFNLAMRSAATQFWARQHRATAAGLVLRFSPVSSTR